jgi:hypothetical protein
MRALEVTSFQYRELTSMGLERENVRLLPDVALRYELDHESKNIRIGIRVVLKGELRVALKGNPDGPQASVEDSVREAIKNDPDDRLTFVVMEFEMDFGDPKMEKSEDGTPQVSSTRFSKMLDRVSNAARGAFSVKVAGTSYQDFVLPHLETGGLVKRMVERGEAQDVRDDFE